MARVYASHYSCRCECYRIYVSYRHCTRIETSALPPTNTRDSHCPSPVRMVQSMPLSRGDITPLPPHRHSVLACLKRSVTAESWLARRSLLPPDPPGTKEPMLLPRCHCQTIARPASISLHGAVTGAPAVKERLTRETICNFASLSRKRWLQANADFVYRSAAVDKILEEGI